MPFAALPGLVSTARPPRQLFCPTSCEAVGGDGDRLGVVARVEHDRVARVGGIDRRL